jgi:4-alpha-glucanotransferase
LPAFDTQRKIETYFEKQEASPLNEAIREGLYALHANIILIEDKAQKGYHFRISMDKTLSFQQLPPHIQERLKGLYLHYFYKKQDDFWKKEAMEKLPALKRSTRMLICGEDLGMVPHCVPDVMRELGILSLEIQRMPKAVNTTFFHPKDAPYLSVVTPDTHDMSTLRGWWEEDQALTRRFYQEILLQHGDAPYFCEPWINRMILEQHFHSSAMWSIFQLQDLMGMDGELRRNAPDEERINIPANPKHYWRYRIHLDLETLMEARPLNDAIRKMIQESGRA